MCRALTVLCVAGGEPSLQSLRRATVATEWELAPGATSEEEALAQLRDRKPHVLVTWGSYAALVRQAREMRPGIRVVAVGRHPIPEADVNLTSIKGVRDSILGREPGGPVRI